MSIVLTLASAGPLPKFEGMPPPPPAPIASAASAAPIQAQGTGIRIPPLNPEKLTQYANLYDQSAGGGYLSGKSHKKPCKSHLLTSVRRTSKGHF